MNTTQNHRSGSPSRRALHTHPQGFWRFRAVITSIFRREGAQRCAISPLVLTVALYGTTAFGATTSSKPDLLWVGAPSINPATAVAGNSINVGGTLKNGGSAAAEATEVKAQIKNSSGNQVATGTVAASALTAGATATVTCAVQLPATLPAGNYVAYLIADNRSALSQIGTSNDYSAGTSFVISAPVAGPAKPSNPSPANGATIANTTTVTLTYTGTPGAVYTIIHNGRTLTANHTGTSYTLTNVAPGPQTWTVIATLNGKSAEAPIWSFNIEAAPVAGPAKPSNPSPANGATIANTSTVPLTYTGTPGAVYTIIHNGRTLTGNHTGTSYTLTNVTPGPQTWTVIATLNGKSAEAPIWSFNIEAAPVAGPAKPSNPSPANGATIANTSTVPLTYTGTPGAVYTIIHNGRTLTANHTGTSYTLTNVAPGPQTWTVIATLNGKSAEAPIWSFNIEAAPVAGPAKPSNPSPANGATIANTSTVPLTYTGTPGAVYTIIHNGRTLTANHTGTSYTLTNVAPGPQTWTVIATLNGKSAEAPIWSFNIEAAPVAGPDEPRYGWPNNGSNIIGLGSVELQWVGTPGARHTVTVNDKIVASDLSANRYTLSPVPTAKVTWKISSTLNGKTTEGPTWSFTAHEKVDGPRVVIDRWEVTPTTGHIGDNVVATFAYSNVGGAEADVRFDGTFDTGLHLGAITATPNPNGGGSGPMRFVVPKTTAGAHTLRLVARDKAGVVVDQKECTFVVVPSAASGITLDPAAVLAATPGTYLRLAGTARDKDGLAVSGVEARFISDGFDVNLGKTDSNGRFDAPVFIPMVVQLGFRAGWITIGPAKVRVYVQFNSTANGELRLPLTSAFKVGTEVTPANEAFAIGGGALTTEDHMQGGLTAARALRESAIAEAKRQAQDPFAWLLLGSGLYCATTFAGNVTGPIGCEIALQLLAEELAWSSFRILSHTVVRSADLSKTEEDALHAVIDGVDGVRSAVGLLKKGGTMTRFELFSSTWQAVRTEQEILRDELGRIKSASFCTLGSDGNVRVIHLQPVTPVSTTARVVGSAYEVGAKLQHPNGNIYDQHLMTGPIAIIAADKGSVARVSFVDLNGDIVQVEFSGAGSLKVKLNAVTGPSLAANYNQADVMYVKGHAEIEITGADESSNVSVISVGPATAVNQGIFRSEIAYDAVADIGLISIASRNGRFGGVRTANASYFATSSKTGLYAPGVQFTGPIFIGDIDAFGSAAAVIQLGGSGVVQINGGELFQSNGRAVEVSGITQLQFVDGQNSAGTRLPARKNRAKLEMNGRDVTSDIVRNPSP